jgi:hypothetical protein
MTDEFQRPEDVEAEDRLSMVMVWVVILALAFAAFGLIIPYSLLQQG